MNSELLLEGAKQLAAGQALGLTPEQTLVLIQREIKLQQQQANRLRSNPNLKGQEARYNPGVTEEYILNQMLQANALYVEKNIKK